MNPWTLITIAYGLTVAGTLGLAWASFASMRRAEREVAALKDAS